MLAIRADRLFDGERFLDGPATVLVADGRIVGVETGFSALPADVTVVDHGDASLLPGLIDSHAHLVADSEWGALDRVAGYSAAELGDVVQRSLAAQLAAGVTTVRDLGDRDWVAVERRDAQRAEGARPPVEPTVLAAGPPITSLRGHCHYLGGEVDGRDAIARAVRERAERRVDVVKVMASGGMNTAGTDVTRTQFSDDELRFLVDESHRFGLPVTAHAHALAAVEQALAAGVDAMEHCSCLTETGVGVPDGVVESLATRQVPVGAALGVPPPEALRRMRPDVRAMMERAGISPEELRDLRLRDIGRMHAAGVRFLAGRDSGITPILAHGSLRNSVSFLVEAGASFADALAAATSRSADACGVGDRKGRVRTGADADLLVVAGDLAADVDRLGDVRAVYLGGGLVPA